MKILTDSLDDMTQEQIKEVINSLGLKSTNYTKQAVLAAIQAAIKSGGFLSYQIAVIIANAVAKQLLGRGLTLVANATLTRAISIFAGPIGWIITELWTALDLAGPAYRVTIPSVIQIAYMRLKVGNEDTLSNRNEDVFDKIRKLSQLKEEGILTEEEFQKKKKELLDSI